MADKQRKYATAKHPTIEALIHGLYKYRERAQAVQRFTNIVNHFVLSKEQPESTPEEPAALLWIKGFAVTPEEEALGYTGHFCEMRIGRGDKGVFTLIAKRIDKPITQHPQKKRLKSKHPNWGHPVMRAVKKSKRYETLEAASAELDLLHQEFPDVSIPGQAKLYIIVYEKREGISRPTHKIALEIKTHTDGGYIITARDNEKQDKPKTVHAPGTTATAGSGETSAAPAQQGYFTSMVALRKKKKRRPAGKPETGLKPKDTPPSE